MLPGHNMPEGGNVFVGEKNPCVNPPDRTEQKWPMGSDFVCAVRERESNKQKEGKKYEISFWWSEKNDDIDG